MPGPEPTASPAPPKLEIRHVSKTYRSAGLREVRVIDDVSLAVADLEFLALVGPSGCGKSTLLRIIDGLVPCDQGTVRLGGREVTGAGFRHGLGMVFQGADLFPWRTVRQNVEFGLEIKGLPAAERRAVGQRYIDLVNLGGFEDAYPHQLSGGMQQRVGTARALAIDPEVLLMDEPFGALDVQTRELMQDELLGIWQRERKTVLFVTHSIEEAIFLADRIVILTPRPARVERLVEVPFPRPRAEAVRASPAFAELRQAIWATLRQGVRI